MCEKKFGDEDCTEFELATAVILNCIREERDNIGERLFVKTEISVEDAIKDLEQLEKTIFLVIKLLLTEMGDTKEMKGSVDTYGIVSDAVKDFDITAALKELKKEK